MEYSEKPLSLERGTRLCPFGEPTYSSALDLIQSSHHVSLMPGQLKQLSILKVDQNRLCEVTEAIGDCENLSELILTENLLTVGLAALRHRAS